MQSMNVNACFKVESVPLNSRTYIEVPGYDTKIPFGVMSSFAYPVEGSGEYNFLSYILAYWCKFSYGYMYLLTVGSVGDRRSGSIIC